MKNGAISETRKNFLLLCIASPAKEEGKNGGQTYRLKRDHGSRVPTANTAFLGRERKLIGVRKKKMFSPGVDGKNSAYYAFGFLD